MVEDAELDLAHRGRARYQRRPATFTIGHVFRRSRFDAPRPDQTPEDHARMRELLATGEYPLVAEAYGTGADLALTPDTFDAGLEWLFDGMQAVLDVPRG